MLDWGDGEYEHTATQLRPVAEVVVRAAAVGRDEDVIDVACGTGNAALQAARAGARVTGVDASERLGQVARERASAEGLELTFQAADALALPFADGTFDLALSVFGVIFAAPAERAAAELLRVVRPSGRIVITSWAPEGAIFEAAMLARRAVTAAVGSEPPSMSGWGDPEVLRCLFAPADVEVRNEHLASPPHRWRSGSRNSARCIPSGARLARPSSRPAGGLSSSSGCASCFTRPTRTPAPFAPQAATC